MTRSSDAASTHPFNPDVVLIGAGIMSATLAVILKEIDPKLKIEIHEILGSQAQESLNAWHNVGTGHAALCELNYTPQRSDGSIDISEALEVNTEFDLSRQLWAYLVAKGATKDPQSFIHPVPHMSFVRGIDNRNFLKKRLEVLSSNPLYYGMEYSEDKKQIKEWIPLVMEGRDPDGVVTATRMVTGTDVDYGALTKDLLDSLREKDGFSIHFCSRVQDLQGNGDWHGDAWNVKIRDEKTGEHRYLQAKFVFYRRWRGGPASLAKIGDSGSAGLCRISSKWNFGCAAITRKFHLVTTQRSTAKLRSDHLRCPCRISTHATSKVNFLCFSGPMQASRQSF